MNLKAINENLTISGESEYKNQKEVECKLNLTDEEFSSVISVDACAFLDDCTAYAGEIKYSGRAVFNLIYKIDGTLTKREYGVEFEYKFSAEKVTAGDKIECEISIDGAKTNYVNGIATARAVINFKGSVCQCVSTPILGSLEGAVCKTEERNFIEEIKRTFGEFKIEDEFEIATPIRNVLSHCEFAVVTGVQSGIGVIIVDGEVYSKLCLLPLSDEPPFSENRVIPFRLEIECEGAMPEHFASASAIIKGVNMKAYVDEGKNKSNLQISIDIKLLGVLYSERNVNLLVDAYSLENNIEFTKTKFNAPVKKGVGSIDKNLELEFNYSSDIGEFICTISDKIESVETTRRGNVLSVIGAISVTALFVKEGEKRVSSFLLPFNFDLDVEDDISFIGAYITGSTVSLNKYSVSLKLSYYTRVNQEFNVLSSFNEGEKRKVSDAAISVYVGKEGDTLWDICKVLGVTEEEVLSVNSELSFPLGGEERIIIYREVE